MIIVIVKGAVDGETRRISNRKVFMRRNIIILEIGKKILISSDLTITKLTHWKKEKV